ncbi:MAG: glycosyltransferase [Symploca sp. SIO3C6]|uniref:Glycosyltransferase n=1 Tax=Symploca sp. SIO1C4 TaxID=2607765 RepID=A0A6B3NBY8_9CYAN|nr:glycosyltransferase [Symploca sp. SIO3C6]NER27151.1 glycosyltransferase [Symploca sp. SIO1C4]
MTKISLKEIFQKQVIKFIFGGGVAAAFNILLIFVIIEWLGFNTPLLRNIANTVAIELSLLLSFFIYRIWVWPGGNWAIKAVLCKQIPLYHIAAGAAVITRIGIVFPLLDWLGVNYGINTLVGVLLSAAINYVISDRLVFKAPATSVDKMSKTDSLAIYHPEGLAPSCENKHNYYSSKASCRVSQQLKKMVKIDLLSIVIPAHNEEGGIANTIQAISLFLEEQEIDYEILVVNDNSRDRTEIILQDISNQNNKVRYLNNYYPNGFGFAVRCGLENFQGDAVVIVMADSSDAPEDIVNYYYKLQEGYECVFGSRFIRGGKVIEYPTHKLIVNRLANLFVQILFGLKYNDTTNAFKAYRREVIEGICPLISHHFNLTVEMPLKAIVRGYSYTTVPITWRNRQTGISKLKIKEMGSRYLFIVLYLFLEKILSRGDYVRKQPQVMVQSKT